MTLGESDTEREYDITYTKLWLVFASIIFLVLATGRVLIDQYVVTFMSLTSGIIHWVLTLLAVVLSVVAGLFWEYSRQRIKIEYGEENV